MEITIPKFLAHLPTYRGMPILYTTLVLDGLPDFRASNMDRVKECALYRLCGVCGHKLGEYIWFIGGPMSLEASCLFSDPPMHEACAAFSLKVCPFLSGKITQHNATRPIPKEVGINPLVCPHRGDRVGMRRCKEYMLVNKHGHGLMEVYRWYGAARYI